MRLLRLDLKSLVAKNQVVERRKTNRFLYHLKVLPLLQGNVIFAAASLILMQKCRPGLTL